MSGQAEHFHRSALAIALVPAALAAACDDPPRTWEGSASAPATASWGAAALPSAPSASGSAAASAAAPIYDGPIRVGGNWVRCYGGFEPEDDPVVDATRLGILCGPSTGMKRLDVELVGEASPGHPPIEDTIRVRQGACYRIFAVGSAGVKDADVTVQSGRGVRIAADHTDDRWPIVRPDRPICALQDDTWTIQLTVEAGAGTLAAEVWELFDAKR